MKQILFSTGNSQKFAKGQSVCHEYGITIVQEPLDIDEVQSEDTEYVARRKAEAAYQLLKQPVVISDDAWGITGLNGFPGTYAKSVNTWFSTDDYIRLTRDLENKEVILIQTLVYQDHDEQLLFVRKTKGIILSEARGQVGAPIQKIVSFEPDQKTSISEKIGDNSHYSGAETLLVWHDFAKWYSKKEKL